ncbi:hypothetical protein [Pseudomonas syringae]|uniref:hypothetical protein n=1 Tax=Pseudomonas syringae TaxID=317 RepID=UPI000E329924|nr:hypothetical protein [Pseudomonas syringae]
MITTKLNTRGLDNLAKRVIALARLKVKTGFFEDTYEDGVPVAQVAAWNEYGTRFHPQRPFMQESLEQAKQKIIQALKLAFKSAIKGDRASRRIMKSLGALVVKEMKATISSYPGGNSPSTIARKGFDRPLFETGKMIESVKFKIGNGAGFE